MSTDTTRSGVAQELLATMKENWDELEEYTELDAIEIAVNELLDYAQEQGWVPKHIDEEIGPAGIVIHY